MKFFSTLFAEVNQVSDSQDDSFPSKQSNLSSHLNKRRSFVLIGWFLALIGAYLAIQAKTSHVGETSAGSTALFIPWVQTLNPLFAGKISRSPSQVKNRFLCNLESDKSTVSFCKSHTVADVLDLAWVINPLFTCRGVGSEDDNLIHFHKNFIGYLKAYGIQSIQIEAIKLNSNQTYHVTRPNMEPFEMQTYYHNCSFMKNNLINRAIRKLELPWEYMLWVDAHQQFENPLWIFDAIVEAEKHAVVQLFEKGIYLFKENRTLYEKPGIIASSFSQTYIPENPFEFGAAFILRRELYEKLGYLIDECIAGDCDNIYSQAAFSNITWDLAEFYPRYSKNVQYWLNVATPIINGSRGFVKGNIFHFHHQEGSFPFVELHQALEWLQFDRERDLKRDENFALYISNDVIANTLEYLFKRVSAIYKHYVDDQVKRI